MSFDKNTMYMNQRVTGERRFIEIVFLSIYIYFFPAVALSDGSSHSKQIGDNRRIKATISGDANQTTCNEREWNLSDKHNDAGTVFWKSKQFDQAATEYEQSYYSCRFAFPALFNMAQAYRFSNKVNDAIFAYEKFINSACEQKTDKNYGDLCPEARRYLNDLLIIQKKEELIQSKDLLIQSKDLQLKRPVWKKGWFWGLLGGSLAVTALTVGVILGTQDRREVVRF